MVEFVENGRVHTILVDGERTGVLVQQSDGTFAYNIFGAEGTTGRAKTLEEGMEQVRSLFL